MEDNKLERILVYMRWSLRIAVSVHFPHSAAQKPIWHISCSLLACTTGGNMRHPYLHLIAMNKQEKTKLKQLVETSFNKLSKHVSELQVRDERLSRKTSNLYNDRQENELDDREVNEYALQTATKKLVALQRTLSKIEEENFGNCIRCGNPIPIARLMAVPEATKCLECAAREPENIYPDFPAVGAYKH